MRFFYLSVIILASLNAAFATDYKVGDRVVFQKYVDDKDESKGWELKKGKIEAMEGDKVKIEDVWPGSQKHQIHPKKLSAKISSDTCMKDFCVEEVFWSNKYSGRPKIEAFLTDGKVLSYKDGKLIIHDYQDMEGGGPTGSSSPQTSMSSCHFDRKNFSHYLTQKVTLQKNFKSKKRYKAVDKCKKLKGFECFLIKSMDRHSVFKEKTEYLPFPGITHKKEVWVKDKYEGEEVVAAVVFGPKSPAEIQATSCQLAFQCAKANQGKRKIAAEKFIDQHQCKESPSAPDFSKFYNKTIVEFGPSDLSEKKIHDLSQNNSLDRDNTKSGSSTSLDPKSSGVTAK
jgi:hypothetical protein